MIKLIVLLSFLLNQGSMLYSQADSIWSTTIAIYHTSDKDLISLRPVNYTTNLLEVAKGSHTVVAYVGHKSNGVLAGFQLGVDYYKKNLHGYYHLGFRRSTASFYPTLSVEGDFYRTIIKGLELGLGYKYLKYETGAVSKIAVGSAFYYTGDWILSYRGSFLDFNSVYHHASAKYIFSEDGLSAGISVSNGGEVISNLNLQELTVASISYGIKWNYSYKKKYNLFLAFNITNRSQLESSKWFESFSVGCKVVL